MNSRVHCSNSEMMIKNILSQSIIHVLVVFVIINSNLVSPKESKLKGKFDKILTILDKNRIFLLSSINHLFIQGQRGTSQYVVIFKGLRSIFTPVLVKITPKR